MKLNEIKRWYGHDIEERLTSIAHKFEAGVDRNNVQLKPVTSSDRTEDAKGFDRFGGLFVVYASDSIISRDKRARMLQTSLVKYAFSLLEEYKVFLTVEMSLMGAQWKLEKSETPQEVAADMQQDWGASWNSVFPQDPKKSVIFPFYIWTKPL